MKQQHSETPQETSSSVNDDTALGDFVQTVVDELQALPDIWPRMSAAIG